MKMRVSAISLFQSQLVPQEQPEISQTQRGWKTSARFHCALRRENYFSTMTSHFVAG
jgi:hypothetical protein